MSMTVEAIYEDGVIRPLRELNLKPFQRIRITIESVSPDLQFVDKKKLRPLMDKVFDGMRIPADPVPAEKVQALVQACGVKPETNEFSRDIIQMREE